MNIFTQSAGGVIARRKGETVEIVLLRDLNFEDWTLPKGHVEYGESVEEACKREVYEEAGLRGIIIHKLLGEFKRRVRDTNEIKTIYYYLITLESSETQFQRTCDNKGFEIKWHDINRLPKLYLEEQSKVINDNIRLIKKVCS